MTRNSKFAWGICFVVVVFVLAFMFFSGRVSKRLPRAARMTPVDVEELPLLMKGKLEVSRSQGHPHSPFGVWGKDRYHFEGTMDIAGIRCPLVTRSYEPFAAFRHDRVEYLVLRFFFLPKYFRIMKVDQNAQLVDVDRADIPFALRLVEFKESETAYLYRAWNLNSLVELGRTKEACELFVMYTIADARFAYPVEKWGNGVRRTELLEFFRQSLPELKCDSATANLAELMDASLPDDDPQIMDAIALGMLRQSSNDAVQYLCGFKARVEAEQVPDDMRLDIFGYGFSLEDKLECGP